MHLVELVVLNKGLNLWYLQSLYGENLNCEHNSGFKDKYSEHIQPCLIRYHFSIHHMNYACFKAYQIQNFNTSYRSTILFNYFAL